MLFRYLFSERMKKQMYVKYFATEKISAFHFREYPFNEEYQVQ